MVGLYEKYRLVHFLDEPSGKSVVQAASSLLSGFFLEARAENVTYGATLALATAKAARELSERLASLPVMADGGTGMTFREDGRICTWHLFLFRSVFPRLELRSDLGESPRLGRKSGERLVMDRAAHLFRSSRLYGRSVDRYIDLKMSSFHERRFYAPAPVEEIAASIGFRKLCHSLWEDAHPKSISPEWQSRLPWRVSSFVKECDRLILHSLGETRMNVALGEMGISARAWNAQSWRGNPGTDEM